MSKEVATIILNRNLPKVGDRLIRHLKKYDSDISDFYLIEAGSDKDKLSKYCTWYVNNPSTMKNGLRFPRGMNFGLHKLYKENKFSRYKAFLLLTNDTGLYNKSFIKPLYKELIKHNRLGIISPCGTDWAERQYLKENKTMYFYYIHNHAYMLKKDFIDKIVNYNPNNYIKFLFDGTNFRGYGTEIEILAKCYVNDYAAGITTKAKTFENENFLEKYYKSIKTESIQENDKLYIEEGKKWMKEKYGFSSKWALIYYAKNFYDRFFENYPELIKYKL